MTYLGNTPTTQNFISGTDYFNGTGAQTAFTLSRTVNSVNDIQVTVNNVVQQPNDAYTLSGTTLTMTSAPSAGTNNVYVRYLSTTTQVITPSQNTVSWNTLDSNIQQDLGVMYKNRIINGNMVIDQRNAGASVTVNGNTQFGVDRFFGEDDTDGVFTLQQSNVAPAGYANSLLATITTADTSLGASQLAIIGHRIEGFNIADLNWGSANAKTVTLSFWVRSSLTGTFGGALWNSAGNRSYPYSYTISSANTWEQKTITIVGDASGTWLTTNGRGVSISWSLGVGSNYLGTASSWTGSLKLSSTGETPVIGTNGATFYITGVQLEVGTQATAFSTAGGSYGAEFALCQRYFYKNSCSVDGNQETPFTPVGIAYQTTTVYIPVIFPTPMRTTPTLSRTGCRTYNPLAGGINLTNATINSACPVSCNVAGIVASGLTLQDGYWISPTTVASDFIAFSAEL